MRVEYKIFLAMFSVALVVFFTVHLVWLPFYWANASSQLVRPANLYSIDTWTLDIIFYSGLAAFSMLIIFELYSWLRKGLANEVVIFTVTFCLTGIGMWLFLAFATLRWGHPLDWLWVLSSSGTSFASKNDYAMIMGTFLFSSIGAVFSTVIYDVYKLVRSVRKRLSKAKVL